MRTIHKDQIAVLNTLGKPSKHKALTTNEIIDNVGFASVNHAYYHLTKMVKHGFLTKEVKGKKAYYCRTAMPVPVVNKK
jgi:hypothetical protein